MAATAILDFQNFIFNGQNGQEGGTASLCHDYEFSNA